MSSRRNGFGLSQRGLRLDLLHPDRLPRRPRARRLCLIAIVANRARLGLVSAEHHTAVEATSYYWHFVDVVWLFLFTTLYVL